MFKIGLAGSFVKFHSGNIKPNVRNQNNGIDILLTNAVTFADLSDKQAKAAVFPVWNWVNAWFMVDLQLELAVFFWLVNVKHDETEVSLENPIERY